MLATDYGSIDWSGLPLAVAIYGVVDIEGLVMRLQLIKSHKPPEA
ncbi:hypothetical protein SNE35_28640 [Paucibacter sp. R3-3]|uniref:Uncharacterized protein n=1 Tax=Roseateles agri TaxID=3098619 RepID=A0ABU5DQ97_9BURK|nr:hypothetical protein [Paucibacter sp. R3-3]MDY0748502.1 hypothetical protein [Paucibacter sp. R3-3]